jgi:uncharacterized membrane protein YgaE (UPF0421/DUF939 family)
MMIVKYEVTEIFVTTITLVIAIILFYFFQALHHVCTIKAITSLMFVGDLIIYSFTVPCLS